ncbi:MAG: lipid-A-disaccharide synthase [Myxococcales bacterium]|nr:lipid-A-disaccharide synthase [Myxococcales bacterium]
MPLEHVMVVAGEASGDQHAADLVAELRRRRPELRFFGMGGPRLAAQGVDLIHHAREISVMGIAEVLPKLPRILQVMDRLQRAAERRKPKLAVLVDVPDFNLRLARQLKRRRVTIAYYVSPMVWAWRQGRTRQIAELVDRMLCILPFEEEFYRGSGVPARYVGSPVLEQVPSPAPPEAFRRALGLEVVGPILALLPGSRPGEIRRILPAMVEAARRIHAARPEVQVVVPVAPSLALEKVRGYFAGCGLSATFVDGRAPEVVGACDVAVVASGTAVLEAGLMLRPMVVVYAVSPLSYAVGRVLVRVPHIALVNLLAGRRVVPELVQGRMTPAAICREVERLWAGPAREEMIVALAQVRSKLGPPGAAARAAAEVVQLLEAHPGE